jgi:ribosomal protein S18 acetylase RimI-like enzyme
MTTFRTYNPDTDWQAAVRIWQEVGWLGKSSTDLEGLRHLIDAGEALVAELHGEAECLVLTTPGAVNYLGQDVPASFVTGVTTSRVARRQGLAGRLTAMAVAEAAQRGELVSALGMFEQGFYNRLGFGTGSYEHIVAFDPSTLRVEQLARPPRRLGVDDWEAVHMARLNRKKCHGACSLIAPKVTQAELIWATKGFGLGYFDGPNGELSHHIWCKVKEAENDKYQVLWITYQSWEQFLELMALIKAMGDQVILFRMVEPGGIQMQDLINQPFRRNQISRKSEYATGVRAVAYWQMRINDLPGCLERTRLPFGQARFNLRLTDPIAAYLGDADTSWKGISGDYVVTLGETCAAEEGSSAVLPTLTASVGAFTRLWMGVGPATGLAVTDELSGPQELLTRLDHLLALPRPHVDWEF